MAVNDRPVISLTSSARTIRRPFWGWIWAAEPGSTAVSRAYSCSGPTVARSRSSRARTAGSVPGNSNSSTMARMYRAEPPTTTGTTPRSRQSAMAARASRWNSATVAVSCTSMMSIRWCRTPPRSARVGLAVPMSIPR